MAYDNITPTDAFIDSRTLERMPRRLKSINLESPATSIVQADVTIAGGYNTDFEILEAESNDGGRRVTDVTINFEGGAGLGRTDGCEQDLYIKRINSVAAASHGNFVLDAKDCYRLIRPVASMTYEPRQATLTPNTLKLDNDCRPCCDCEDFMAVYEAIRRLRERYYEIGVRATTARDQHRENISRWNEQGALRASNPLRLTVLPLSCCQIGITGAYCNSSGDVLEQLELRFRISGDGTGTPVCGQAFRAGSFQHVGTETAGRASSTARERYEMSGEWPQFSAFFDIIPKGGMALVTFMLDMQGCANGDALDISLGAYDGVTGTQMQYDESWPDAETFRDVPQLDIRAALFSGDLCDESATCENAVEEEASSSGSESSSSSAATNEECCTDVPTSFSVKISGIPWKTCGNDSCSNFNGTFTCPTGGDADPPVDGVCNWQYQYDPDRGLCDNDNACIGVQLDGRVQGKLDVFVFILEECANGQQRYATFKKSFTGLPTEVDCASLLSSYTTIPYSSTTGTLNCAVDQATVRVRAN